MSNAQSDLHTNVENATFGPPKKDPIRYVQHELRTPLNHILGFSELLIEEVRTTDFAELTPGLRTVHDTGNFILARLNETFVTIGEHNWTAQIDSLRQDIHRYAQQIATDANQVRERALALGAISEISPLDEICGAAAKLDALVDDTLRSLDPLIQQANAANPAPKLSDTKPHLQKVTPGLSAANRAVGMILVVDDNDANREMLSYSLERQGHTVCLAENGRQAIDLIRTQQFDLILLDIMMPEMTGYQVLESMKADDSLRHIPVIMISGVDDLQGVVKCIEMGAEDHLHKPFDAVLLRARINASLEKKRMRDQEMLYLAQVEVLMTAAAAVEAGKFDQESLKEIAARQDNLGQLARVFQHMAQEVSDREQRLRQEVQQLRIQIDEGWMQEKIDEITDTEYFHRLEVMANELRQES